MRLRFVEPVTGPEIYDEAYYQGRGVDPLVDYVAEYADYRRTPRVDEFKGLANLAERHFSSRPDAVRRARCAGWTTAAVPAA